MFTEYYTNPTIFVTEPSVLPNVKVPDYGTDRSLAETVKALLYDRIGDATFVASIKDLNKKDKLEDAVSEWALCGDNLAFVFKEMTVSEMNSFRKWAEKDLCLVNCNRLVKLSDAMNQKCGYNCEIYASKTENRALVVAKRPNLSQWHVLQAMFYRMFPQMFEPQPLTQNEKELIVSLTLPSMENYASWTKKLAERPELRDLHLKKSLAKVQSRYYETKIDGLTKQRDTALADKINVEKKYVQVLEMLEKATFALEGAKALLQSQTEDDSLYEYFRNNRQLCAVKTTDEDISFIVKTFLDIYDPEVYADLARRGFIFEGHSIPAADCKLLMDAIFSDSPEFRVKICAKYTLALRGLCLVESHARYPIECIEYIANPHIQWHACLGSYKMEIDKALQSGNVIGAVEQCIASCQSVNLGETTMTFIPMMRDVFNAKDVRCLRRKDGVDMSPTEAIEYLKGEKQ